MTPLQGQLIALQLQGLEKDPMTDPMTGHRGRSASSSRAGCLDKLGIETLGGGAGARIQRLTVCFWQETGRRLWSMVNKLAYNVRIW